MRNRQERGAAANRRQVPAGAAVQPKLRRAAAADDLDVAPEYTLRVPGPETIFLINPFGLHYSEVPASNLVSVDIEGHPVRPAEYPINLAGVVTHSAIHGNSPVAHCVMHTHTTSGSAVACLEEGLSHDTFYGAQLYGRVAYHEFEGVTVEPDERQRMVASIGDKRVVILRNHGLLTWGETLEEAIAMARDAIRLHIEALIADGEPVPDEAEHPQALVITVAA